MIVPLSITYRTMSFLFHKKNQRKLKYVWVVLAVLIMISMVLLFSPGLVPA